MKEREALKLALEFVDNLHKPDWGNQERQNDSQKKSDQYVFFLHVKLLFLFTIYKIRPHL